MHHIYFEGCSRQTANIAGVGVREVREHAGSKCMCITRTAMATRGYEEVALQYAMKHYLHIRVIKILQTTTVTADMEGAVRSIGSM